MSRIRLPHLTALLTSIFFLHTQAYAINLGDPLPQMTFKNVNGADISISSFLGNVVYIDVWATWCPSCVQSLPWMSKLESKFAGKEFKVLAINVDDDNKTAEEFLSIQKLSLNVAFDPKGSFPDSIDVKVMPTSLLINKIGQVILIHEGFSLKDASKIEAEIEKALIPSVEMKQ